VKKRVLLAGIFHETHTFLEDRTRLEQFEVLREAELLSARGDASPLGGIVEFAASAGWELLPAIDLRAVPSGTVEDRVVEVFWEEFRRVALRERPRGVDGICLILHGAMVSESFVDVEGELLGRIRRLEGFETTPLTGVLDLHANTTPRMAEAANGLIAYRENPHADARAAALDGARLLDRLMTAGERPVTVWDHPPIVWPPPGTGTAQDPMKTLEAMAREIERSHPEILAVNVFGGFAFADTPDTGVSFTAVTVGDPRAARAELARLSRAAMELRDQGNVIPPPLDTVFPQLSFPERGPLLIVEPSDNVGGGAPGDATALARAMIDRGIPGSVAMICDGDAVREAARRRPGERFRLAIGGKKWTHGPGPLDLEVELVSTSDGKFELEDPESHLASMGGRRVDMGPCAVVRHRGTRLLLMTRNTPPWDLGQLRSQGIEPTECSVIAIKAAVAHRRAYDPIAKGSVTVDTPGPCSSNLKSFPYRRLRRPIFPLDPLP
jgi:microcystin degradation protein MlrC